MLVPSSRRSVPGAGRPPGWARLGFSAGDPADQLAVRDAGVRRRHPGAFALGPGWAVAGRGDGRGEGRAYSRRAVLCARGLLRGPRLRPEGRAHVPVRGGRQRGDRRGRAQRVAVPCRDARPAHRGARAHSPGRPARRSHNRSALSRAQARAGIGYPHPGDLHAARARGRVRARHAARRRSVGDRHDRVPVRAGADRCARARAPARGRVCGRADRAHPRARFRSRLTTSAASARCISAASRIARPRSTRRRCWR